MKKLLLLLCIFISTAVLAVPSPFQPKDEKLISEGIMTLTSGSLIVGSSTGKGVQIALSGDATISSAGALTVAAGSITEAKLAVPTVDSLNSGRIARVTYDVAVDGGAIGAHLLGITLPANLIITRSWFFTDVQFVDAGAGTVALSCEDANNILSAVDITAITSGTKTTGAQDDAIANFTGGIAAACEVTATVAVAAQTAGKLVLFIEYIVAE